jgi:hypothetical protein
MSASWWRGVVCTLVCGLVIPSAAAAHRLDEYLQAARLAVSTDSVAVELDLTPGVNVARAVASRIDCDADGAISPAEAEAYGRLVAADLELSVDGQRAPLTLTSVDSPPIAEMLDGVGTIRLAMHAHVGQRSAARMAIRFANGHDPGESVYLVNALKTADSRLTIERQSRDTDQRSIDLQYAVHQGRTVAIGWSAAALALVLGLAWLRS